MSAMPVYALLLAAPEGSGAALPAFLFQVVAIFAIFYFIMIRPQQKQRKAHDERLRGLKRGDEIVTAGGIVGEIVHIASTVKEGEKNVGAEDRITIRSGESRLIVERARITRVITAPGAVPAAPPTKGPA